MTQTSIITTKWTLIRHGPVINPGGLIYGAADRDIAREPAGLYAPLAGALEADALILTSTLGRTVKTLQRIAEVGGLPMPAHEPVAAFDEQSFGAWEGMTWEALHTSGVTHTFWLAPAATRPPEGESFEDLMGRVAQGLREMTARHQGRNIVLIAHGGTIRAALAHALGLDGETVLRFSIENCSLTQISHLALSDGTETWSVGRVNMREARHTMAAKGS